MKRSLLHIAVMALSLAGCARTSRETWEDTKTCGRYMGRGIAALFGRHDTSQEYAKGRFFENEYEPMVGQEISPLQVTEFAPPSREAPGDPGSPIPGIESFSSPSGNLAELFKHIHFSTDEYTIKGEDNYHYLHEIARYLIKNPRLYIFIEGHADERGPSAYNLALGAKRSNSVRTFLIQNGVNPDQLFTISYGKEKPLVPGHDALAWEKNRRAQFKLYDR